MGKYKGAKRSSANGPDTESAEKVDPYDIYHQGLCFSQMCRMIENHMGNSGEVHLFFAVSAVGFLALELHLKCLYALDHDGGMPPWTHSPKELFQRLNDGTRAAIDEHYKAAIAPDVTIRRLLEQMPGLTIDLSAVLERCEDLFLRLRYYHEKKPWTNFGGFGGTAGLFHLSIAVHRVILDRNPDWQYIYKMLTLPVGPIGVGEEIKPHTDLIERHYARGVAADPAGR